MDVSCIFWRSLYSLYTSTSSTSVCMYLYTHQYYIYIRFPALCARCRITSHCFQIEVAASVSIARAENQKREKYAEILNEAEMENFVPFALSYYPASTHRSSDIFNSRDVISSQETDNGQTTISLNLSGYVEKAHPVIEGELYLKPGVSVSYGGKIQSSAFDDLYKDNLETNTVKLTDISFNNNETFVANKLNLENCNTLFPNENIPQNKITGLVARLTDIDFNNLFPNRINRLRNRPQQYIWFLDFRHKRNHQLQHLQLRINCSQIDGVIDIEQLLLQL